MFCKEKNSAVDSEEEEAFSIDLLIESTIKASLGLPASYNIYLKQIEEIKYRLSKGRLHIGVVGEFNRGKSTFINALIGNKILPTSVLPVTSIPTRIVYADSPVCIVKFLKNKPDLVVTQSKEKIVETLLQYATEKKNPKNQFSVSSIEVQYPSRLLENGTVIIDTPGFGSTHIHNTMLALESLTECDAIIFLLSAESPLTHTELEFLKLLTKKTPRIFFVLNKVDLLNATQLKEVEFFIKKTLKEYLAINEEIKLLSISALIAEKSIGTSDNSKLWELSGMERVKSDIIVFMTREKYFTLAMALSDKLKESIKGILILLQKEKSELENPVLILSKEEAELARMSGTLTKSLTEITSGLTTEKNNLLESIKNNLPGYEERVKSKIKEALELLIKPSNCNKKAIKDATISLNCIIEQLFSSLKKDILFTINSSLKNIFAVYSKKSEEILDCFLKKLFREGKEEINIWTKINKIEVKDPFEKEIARNPMEIKLALKWYECFFSRSKRIKKIEERFDREVKEKIKNYCGELVERLILSTEEIFESAKKILTKDYDNILKIIRETLEKKRKSLLKEREKIEIRLKNIETRIDSLSKILDKIK